MDAILAVDKAILLFLQNDLRSPILNAIMVFFTTIGDAGAVWLLLGIVLLFFKRGRKLGFCLLLAMAFTWLVNELAIKNVVCRPRPFNVIPELTTLVSKPTSWSFPSGHACASFSAAYVLTRLRGKKAAWVYVVAAVIALSRPYVGVHYPTDILAGAITGTLGGVLFTWIIAVKLDRPVSKLLRTKEGI